MANLSSTERTPTTNPKYKITIELEDCGKPLYEEEEIILILQGEMGATFLERKGISVKVKSMERL